MRLNKAMEGAHAGAGRVPAHGVALAALPASVELLSQLTAKLDVERGARVVRAHARAGLPQRWPRGIRLNKAMEGAHAGASRVPSRGVAMVALRYRIPESGVG